MKASLATCFGEDDSKFIIASKLISLSMGVAIYALAEKSGGDYSVLNNFVQKSGNLIWDTLSGIFQTTMLPALSSETV